MNYVAVLAETEETLQYNLNMLNEELTKICMKLNTVKTKDKTNKTK